MYSKSIDTAAGNRMKVELGARMCVDRIDQEALARWETGGFEEFYLQYLS
jgi:hypothetical protein